MRNTSTNESGTATNQSSRRIHHGTEPRRWTGRIAGAANPPSARWSTSGTARVAVGFAAGAGPGAGAERATAVATGTGRGAGAAPGPGARSVTTSGTFNTR